jgi:hypothetical protein
MHVLRGRCSATFEVRCMCCTESRPHSSMACTLDLGLCISLCASQVLTLQHHASFSCAAETHQHASTWQLRWQRSSSTMPQCSAIAQETSRLPPLQPARHSWQHAVVPASPTSVAHPAAAEWAPVHQLSSGSNTAPTVLRGEASGTVSDATAALLTAAPSSQQPSMAELAAALAELPSNVSSAAVLDGVWLDMHDICRCFDDAMALLLHAQLIGEPLRWEGLGAAAEHVLSLV